MEIYYIQYYKSIGCKLINTTDGGEGNLGNKWSQHQRELMEKHFESKAKKIYQYDLDGNLIKIWKNTKEVVFELHLKNASGITRCLRKERYKYLDSIWTETPSDFANKEYLESLERRKARNKTKDVIPKGCGQGLFGRILSMEAAMEGRKHIYVYTNKNMTKDCLVYEGVSIRDAGYFLMQDFNTQIDAESAVYRCLRNQTPYYDKYYFSYTPPSNYINSKHENLVNIYFNGKTLFGVSEAALFFKTKRCNISNNLYRKTTYLTTEEFGKIQLQWGLNKENCRLIEKSFGLSVDKIEEILKDNIELTL